MIVMIMYMCVIIIRILSLLASPSSYLLVLLKGSSLFQEWLHLYSTRRYGKQIKGLQYAWKILLHTLYNCTDGAYVSCL